MQPDFFHALYRAFLFIYSTKKQQINNFYFDKFVFYEIIAKKNQIFSSAALEKVCCLCIVLS